MKQQAFTLADTTCVAMPNRQLNFGFTLAEVLITLGIIGVVTAITIPTLINKYQKIQTVNQLKKFYSEINQAVKLSENNFGTSDTWDFNIENFSNNAQEQIDYFSENYLYPNIKIVKKCVPSSNECWADDIYTLDRKNFTGQNLRNNVTGRNAFITASGYSVLYWLHGAGDGGWFCIDINGPKKPNIAGKDIFIFLMHWGGAELRTGRIAKLVPVGFEDSTLPTRENIKDGGFVNSRANYNCRKGTNKTASGGYCGALIMMDSWQIAPDYPW